MRKNKSPTYSARTPDHENSVENRAQHGAGVQEDLPGERLAYTTVQTMLNILQRKGRVKRTLVGKAYEYRAVLSRDKAIREALRDLLDRVFGGSVEALLITLVKSHQLDAAQLSKLQQMVESHSRESRREDHD